MTAATTDLACRYCRRACTVQAELDRGAAILQDAGLAYRGKLVESAAICPVCAGLILSRATLPTVLDRHLLTRPASIVLTRCGTGFCVDLLDMAKRMVHYLYLPDRATAKVEANKLAAAIAAGERPWEKVHKTAI